MQTNQQNESTIDLAYWRGLESAKAEQMADDGKPKTRAGTFNQGLIAACKPEVLALAKQAGSMAKLADQFGMHQVKLYEWARGVNVPNLSKLVALGRYAKAEAYCQAIAGKSLAQLFGQLQASKAQVVPFTVLEDIKLDYDPEAALILGADLGKAIKALRPQQRRALILHAQGYTLAEIGKALAVSRWWACCLVDQARAEIKALLTESGSKTVELSSDLK